MKFEECIKLANENKVAFVATAEGDQPRVRAMLMWFADETGFYFQTGAMKELCGQLKKNPNVELCFFDPKLTPSGTMMRVAGKIEFVEDKALKKKALQDRPFLKAMGFTEDSPALSIFRLAKGEAYFWSRETNMDPKQFIKFG